MFVRITESFLSNVTTTLYKEDINIMCCDLISVIVPVYNVEKYLVKCIESIINQTYKNIEIILVDDGSTDSSSEICDNYSMKYNNIITFHKKNGGLSSARNYGIENCNGEYITFVDSDDYISNVFIQTLYSAVKNKKADLVISGLKDFYENEIVKADNIDLNVEKVITKEIALKKMLLQEEIDVNSTAKLYSKKIFENIRFPEGKLYEDIQIIDDIISNASCIVQISYRGYYYLQRVNSIMYGKMSIERLVLIEKTKQLIQYTKENYPDIVDASIKRYIYCNFHLLGRSVVDNNYKNISIELKDNIITYKKKIYRSDIFSTKEKIATFVLRFGLVSYKIFWKGYCLMTRKEC